MYNNKGITLVVLIITVVVMLILAGVAISVLTGDGGLFDKTRNAALAYEEAVQNESEKIQKWMNEIDEYLTGMPSSDLPITTEELENMINGNFDENKKIHVPKLVDGMIPVYWENGVEKELTSTSTEIEWNKWYDYVAQTGTTENGGTSKWANAVTKDSNGNITGYYVWIPRYEYKIIYNNSDDYSQGGIIDVNFIEVGQEATEGYIIHPVFQNNPEQGGWDSELPGFWIAKYPAGYQANTVDVNGNLINGEDEVQYSTLFYTYPGDGINDTNALGQKITSENYNNNISYPVFKPLTYVYNCINIDSIFRIAQEMKNATNFYGLNNVDTHLIKNSEWGAVAYLTWSKYGRNGTEPNRNNVNLIKSANRIYAITGIYSNGTDDVDTKGSFIGNVYNTIKGQLGSSTGNITGVYDLNGCIWNYTASYLDNENMNLSLYGDALVSANIKYKNIYLQGDIDNSESNYFANNFKGDAIRETSVLGIDSIETDTNVINGNGWNGDRSGFVYGEHPFFFRGGACWDTSDCGIFAFSHGNGGGAYTRGFRVVVMGIN